MLSYRMKECENQGMIHNEGYDVRYMLRLGCLSDNSSAEEKINIAYKFPCLLANAVIRFIKLHLLLRNEITTRAFYLYVLQPASLLFPLPVLKILTKNFVSCNLHFFFSLPLLKFITTTI